MKKTFKVVMLPTEKASFLILERTRTNPRLIFNYNDTKSLREQYQFQELYIISDDEIKVGDWYLRLIDNTITKANINSDHKHYECKKIVATTDKSLTFLLDPHKDQYGDLRYNKFQELPQLPESFIQAYIKAYNEGKPITEVDLEMQYMALDNSWDTIKTRPDNTVIVHQSKMYSRDEVRTLILTIVREISYGNEDLISHYDGDFKDADKWIQDNL